MPVRSFVLAHYMSGVDDDVRKRAQIVLQLLGPQSLSEIFAEAIKASSGAKF